MHGLMRHRSLFLPSEGLLISWRMNDTFLPDSYYADCPPVADDSLFHVCSLKPSVHPCTEGNQLSGFLKHKGRDFTLNLEPVEFVSTIRFRVMGCGSSSIKINNTEKAIVVGSHSSFDLEVPIPIEASVTVMPTRRGQERTLKTRDLDAPALLVPGPWTLEVDQAEFSREHRQTALHLSQTLQPTYPFISLKAALIIQTWYRRYRARLRVRQHYALAIFQSIEYADEQGQMQLSNFFSFMLENYTKTPKEDSALVSRLLESTIQENKARQDYVSLIEVPDSYDGPRLQFPLTFTDIDLLLQAFKQQQTLHAHYVLEVLFEARKVLKQMPNFTHIKTFPCKEVTICGDLHGKLDDLLLIFYKNGLPSENNRYVFNGDFVDRGNNSMEVLMILLVSFLVYPTDVHLNRGNHEDFMMNLRYGFTREVLHKYKLHGRKILQILEEVYTWLPIGTIIDDEILIIHGGVSESTDLNTLHCLQRNKMRSVLMPPMSINREHAIDLKRNKAGSITGGPRKAELEKSSLEQLTKQEWEQIVDLLWSDPKGRKGCYPNTSRGGGCYFGPDVTSKILSRNQLKMLIRSHECKPDGYEICHDGKVITVFSASNYYEEGSNRGAYIRVGYGTSPQFFQYQVTSTSCLSPLHQRVNAMEFNAFKILKERMLSRKTDLINAFQLRDYGRSGKISLAQWAFSMESILGLNLPWRSLRSHLVNIDSDGNVDYMSSFQDVHIEKPVKEMKSSLIETLYRYRSDLKIIFNVIDTDHSGMISMDEFRTMWKLFNTHYNVHIDDSQIDELANTMDFNKDGSIDFNEFLKAFYVVHKYEKPDSHPD